VTSDQAANPSPRRYDARHIAKVLLASLWLPAVFFFGFLLCYLLPFHNPTPHDVPLAVPARAAGAIERQLNTAVPGWFQVQPVADGTPARLAAAVRDQSAVAAFFPDPARPTLLIAGANGAEVNNVARQTFTAAAAAQGRTLTILDVAPGAPKDGFGTSVFYIGLALTVPAYVTILMLLRAPAFSRWRKVVGFLLVGALASVVAFYIALAMDCITDRPLSILFMFLLSEAIALTGYGLVPFVRQVFPGIAITIYLLLSVPASGGAVSIHLVPAFFRALHPFFPLGNFIEAMRSHMYFDNNKLAEPVLSLSLWVFAGAVLVCLGWLLERRRLAADAHVDRRMTAADLERSVEDPGVEMPLPTAVTAHTHQIGNRDWQLAGRVESGHAEPIADVRITVANDKSEPLLHLRTDEHGEYCVTGLPQGTVYVIASSKSSPPAIARAEIVDGRVAVQNFILEGGSAKAEKS
jgi:Carboxypeptidase regulatory-like domain